MDASFWGPMWRELGADVTLLTPEFPGFGSAGAEETPSIAGFADTVAELIEAEGAGPAIVVGVSLGGYVALALAIDHPQTVAALVLANTRADADDPPARRAREQAIDTIRIDGLQTYLAELVPRLLSPIAATETWERVFAIAENQDREAVCDALEALRDRPDRTDDVPGIQVRAVVVGGEDDLITPPEALAALTDAIPGATKVVLSGAGHLSAIERPVEFAAIVARMIPT
jgi:3-oxoadipate enol-lactonase